MNLSDDHEKMLANFPWINEGDDEGKSDIDGYKLISELIECVYELVEYTLENIKLQNFEGMSFSIPLLKKSNICQKHPILVKCLDNSCTEESRSIVFNGLQLMYTGIMSDVISRNDINNKIQEVLPHGDHRAIVMKGAFIHCDIDCPVKINGEIKKTDSDTDDNPVLGVLTIDLGSQ